jgi:hypothetical protein
VAESPPLSDLAERALHCWGFCAGWAPALWPIYAALYPVDDWHDLIDLMQIIRANV